MHKLTSLSDISLLRESLVLECKAAQGISGQGEVPKDFWPTYSAMSNAHGGLVILGIQEKSGVFSVVGLKDINKVRSDLFNILNNPGKVSINLLRDSDAQELELDGKLVLILSIPQAGRKDKPVYLNGQPLGNTYRRLNDGDRKCDDTTVKRMLAEQVQDSRDTYICNRYGLNDIDLESLHAFRNQFASNKPGHPWVGADDTEFLHLLGAWREDRETKENGLTLAGVLMFGQWPAIMTCAPLYFVDYQDQPDEPDTSVRWLDRVVPDGTWSGNLFDFYRKVIRKLTADLKVPFHLQGDKRVDDTPIHQALREALVNTLVHADYSDRASVRVIKRPSGFEFRNPGALRVPVAQSLMTMDWALETVSGKMSGKATLEILGLVKQDSRLTVSELAITLELSERTIERAIQSLRADGRLERIGPSKGGFWKVLK